MINQEQILSKIETDLNALVIELGFVDENGNPLYNFYGKVSTYDDYQWSKAIEEISSENKVSYSLITPFVLIRENSLPSAGETIAERLDDYTFFCYIKSDEQADIRELLETYMARENGNNNLSEISGDTVLKTFSNFLIDDEQLVGAPDGESRYQVSLTFSYDIFESSLTCSKNYELYIDNVQVKYLSWRFEKANLVIANSQNTSSGTNISNVNKLHGISLICELYIDKNNTSLLKIRNDLYSKIKTNTSYDILLKSDEDELFNASMIVDGGKTSDTPPQINTMIITFALSYLRATFKIGILGVNNNILENIPVLSYKWGHAASLNSAAYFSDNSSKSRVVGLAKALSVVVSVLTSDSTIMPEIIKEVLGKVYTNIYLIEMTYLGVVYTYNMVLNNSSLESEDAAYDSLPLTFVEAK